ncbi:hypothetical protein ACFX19_031363 [Malus domestica]
MKGRISKFRWRPATRTNTVDCQIQVQLAKEEVENEFFAQSILKVQSDIHKNESQMRKNGVTDNTADEAFND